MLLTDSVPTSIARPTFDSQERPAAPARTAALPRDIRRLTTRGNGGIPIAVPCTDPACALLKRMTGPAPRANHAAAAAATQPPGGARQNGR